MGCPRSGTTLLALMIHAHPRLAMPPESRFLTTVWRARQKFGDLSTRDQRRALARACVRRGSRIGHLGLERRPTRRAILAAPPTLGSAIGTVFQLYAEQHGAARWGDKRPAYFQEVDVLLQLFPDAQIVHIIRDGRANVSSLKRMPWWPYDSIGSMAAWSQAEYCARRDAKRLPDDVFHVLRYESLVADPESVLRELCAFLEEDFHPAMLEPAAVRHVVPEDKVWHRNLDEAVGTHRVASWRSGLDPWEIGLMETVLRRPLRRWGYPISGEGTKPSAALVARYLGESARRHLAMRMRWASERRAATRSALPLAAELTEGQQRIAAERRARGQLRQPGG